MTWPTAAIIFTMVISVIYLIEKIITQNAKANQFAADITAIKEIIGEHARNLSMLNECVKNLDQGQKRIEGKIDIIIDRR